MFEINDAVSRFHDLAQARLRIDEQLTANEEQRAALAFERDEIMRQLSAAKCRLLNAAAGYEYIRTELTQ